MKAINNIHRILLGAAFTGGALFAVSLTTDGAAHADVNPAAVVEHPGGLLDAVTGTVDQVTPEPTKPVEPEPEPEPEPPTEQEPASEEPPANPIGDVIEDVEGTVDEVVEVITTAPAPAVVVTSPPLVIVTLPVLVPTPTPPAHAAVPQQPAALPEPPICDDPDRDPAQPRSDGKQHRRIHTTPDRAAGQPHPGRPCPNTPGNPSQANTTPSVKPPPPTGEQLVAISAAGAYSRPVLHRLTQIRARSDLPAGRDEHPEPGPA